MQNESARGRVKRLAQKLATAIRSAIAGQDSPPAPKRVEARIYPDRSLPALLECPLITPKRIVRCIGTPEGPIFYGTAHRNPILDSDI